MEDITTKVCSKCKQTKPLSEFNKDNKTKDGYRGWCKSCYKTYFKNYNLLHKIDLTQYKHQYHLEHKDTDKYKENAKKYQLHNREHKKQYKHQHYIDNKAKNKERDKNYRINNKNKISARCKKWYSNIINKSKRNEKQRLRYKNDPNYKLMNNIRTRNCMSLLYKYKNTSSQELLGCTIDELWTHLEKQFRDGMTRENHGKVWHIDHIIPLKFFEDNELIDKTNLKIAFHYGNLQPLLIAENLSKGDKLPENTNFKYFN